MKCIDCDEEMSEKEAKRSWNCMDCDGPMHVECAMEAHDGRDLCEHCYNRTARAAAVETLAARQKAEA